MHAHKCLSRYFLARTCMHSVSRARACSLSLFLSIVSTRPLSLPFFPPFSRSCYLFLSVVHTHSLTFCFSLPFQMQPPTCVYLCVSVRGPMYLYRTLCTCEYAYMYIYIVIYIYIYIYIYIHICNIRKCKIHTCLYKCITCTHTANILTAQSDDRITQHRTTREVSEGST